MSGPFGIQQGATKNDIKVGEELSRFIYVIPEVPKPHSAFPSVCAQITPKNGVSFIGAMGNLIQTSGAGLEIKSEFNKITEKLTKTYGMPQLIDSFNEGGLYSDYNDWMDSIANKERQFFAFWSKSNGLELPNNLNNIALGVFVEDTWGGNVYLEYRFDNFDNAIKEMDELEHDAL